MKIIDLLNENKLTISFEVFPPKTESAFDSIRNATEEIASLSPSFMSVTYGAGGGTSAFTADIAADIAACGVTPLAHLTCVSATHESIAQQLDLLRAKGVENILALRGDVPAGQTAPGTPVLRYASELTRQIVDFGGFCVGGACYPECHPESEHQKEDILNLKRKVDAGCEFLTTQMFFDNNILYNFIPFKTLF